MRRGPYHGDEAPMLLETGLLRPGVACDLDIDIRSEEMCSVQMTWKLFLLPDPPVPPLWRGEAATLDLLIRDSENKQTNN